MAERNPIIFAANERKRIEKSFGIQSKNECSNMSKKVKIYLPNDQTESG